MPLIQITPENMRSQANTVRRYKQEQATNMKKIRNLIYSLEDGWKGDAQDAFFAKFNSMEYIYRQFEDVLEEYADLMDKAANEMQSMDQTIKRMIQNI